MRLHYFLYNLDRAVASLFGAPPQETISSEVARVARGEAHAHSRFETWGALKLARLLGVTHGDKAIKLANALDRTYDLNK